MAETLTTAAVPDIVRLFSRLRKRIPLESGNYPYATARVRAKKSVLLSKDTYDRMLQMETPQIARLLSEGGYKDQILALGIIPYGRGMTPFTIRFSPSEPRSPGWT